MAKVKRDRADHTAKVARNPRVKQQPASSEDEMPKAKATASKRGESTGRTKKAKKDPNAPKRGLSAYMFYANANRDRVRQEQPDISFGQVGKKLGEEWKALDASERAKYEEMARKDKKRYEDAKAAYNAADEDDEGSD